MTDATIIGGGIVGLATAFALTRDGDVRVRLIEKETALAQHQSTHNSGVLHAGLQYRPGSEKARLARIGIRRMNDFCVHHGIEHEICGKLVVAANRSELPRLEEMHERGARFKTTTLSDEFTFDDYLDRYRDGLTLMCVLTGDDSLTINTVDDPLIPTPGQTIIALVASPSSADDQTPKADA